MDVYNAYLYDNYVTCFDYILLYGEKLVFTVMLL